MKLFFRPLACSLAVRIVAEELGLPLAYHDVDDGTQSPEDRAEFLRHGFGGHVPLLVTDDGQAIHEGPAILQYLADASGARQLLPAPGTVARARVQQWLNFASAELHRGVFSPLMAKDVPDGARQHAKALAGPRFAHLERALEGRDHLAEGFTLADAYLLPLLNWCETAGIRLADWPVVAGYRDRLRRRPSVERAIRFEAELYYRRQH